jgi:hypothetical protein
MKISVKEPCSENWDSMKILDKSRFCESCKCKVYDFTQASVEDVKRQYELNSGKICGRLNGSLLAQTYQQNEIRRGYLRQLRMFCIAALLSFGINLFFIPDAKARLAIDDIKTEILDQKNDTILSEVKLSGLVSDKNTKEALPFANIALLESDSVIACTTTDLDGKYELKVAFGKYKKLNVKATYVGYMPMIIKDLDLSKDLVINVDLEMSMAILGGLIIMEEPVILTDTFQSGKKIKRKDFKRMPK